MPTEASTTETPAVAAPPSTETPPAAVAAPPVAAPPVVADVASALSEAGVDEAAVAEFDLKVPEGAQVDEKMMAEFKALAKEQGLEAPKAQAIFDKYVTMEKAKADADEAVFKAQDKKWADEWRADTDIGGEKVPQSLQHIRRALTQFGGKPLVELVERAGLGNHPTLVKAFVKIGRALGEDSAAGTSAHAAAPPDAETLLRQQYPTMYPKE